MGRRLGIMTASTSSDPTELLGYPAPTYLNCIDGWLGDEVLFEALSTTDCNAQTTEN